MRSILGGPRILDRRFDLAGMLTKTETSPSLRRSALLLFGGRNERRGLQGNEQRVGVGCRLRPRALPGHWKEQAASGGERRLGWHAGGDSAERCQIGSGLFGQRQISVE